MTNNIVSHVDSFKRTTRMTDLVPGLKKAGQYHIGPCPFCGGKDRFNVKTADGGDLWICRQCGDGKYHDVIDFLMQRDGRTFAEVVGAAAVPRRALMPTPAPAAVPDLATAPAEDWQIPALMAAAVCSDFLQSGDRAAAAALAYLHDKRKLTDVTLHDHMIGFNPAWRTVADIIRPRLAAMPDYRPSWLDAAAGVWLAPGITIPAMIDGELWYLNVRTTAAARTAAEASGRKLGKYHALPGSRLGALFNGDRLIRARAVFVVEGEFDAMVLNQYIPPEVVAVTMGSAGSLPSNTWLRYFAAAGDIYLLLDDDAAGRAALGRWQRVLPRARSIRLPDGSKDISDYRRAGGAVWSWAAAVLRGDE